MHRLQLLRHAKSNWEDRALPDFERPLAPRGVRDAKRIGKHLRGLEVAPELVLCSSAARARETFELVRSALAGVPVQLEDGLYGASSEALLARLRAVPDAVGCVLLVGHNPGLQELALALAARGTDLERVEAKFPTAALATLAVPPWSELGWSYAELLAYVVPKQLR